MHVKYRILYISSNTFRYGSLLGVKQKCKLLAQYLTRYLQQDFQQAKQICNLPLIQTVMLFLSPTLDRTLFVCSFDI